MASNLAVIKPKITRVDSEHFVSVIQSELMLATRNHEKISHIARRANLSPATVSKIMYGETKFPRLVTVVSLLAVFGYLIYAER